MVNLGTNLLPDLAAFVLDVCRAVGELALDLGRDVVRVTYNIGLSETMD